MMLDNSEVVFRIDPSEFRRDKTCGYVIETDVFLDMCALLESCYTLPVLKKKYRMSIV